MYKLFYALERSNVTKKNRIHLIRSEKILTTETLFFYEFVSDITTVENYRKRINDNFNVVHSEIKEVKKL